MDITAFDSTGPANEGAKMELRLPNGEPALKDDGTPVTITLLGADSDAYQRASKALGNRSLRNRSQPLTVEQAITESINLLAKVTVSWDGLTEDGQPLPCTEENAKRLYRSSLAVREQVAEFVNDRGNFVKASPKA